MTVFQKGSEKSHNYREFRFLTTEQMGGLAREKPSKSPLERDKRIRREIANSNERRRMQSINSGFTTLRSLLPATEDEKRSKSAILHQASDYITKLEQEKSNLMIQNAKLVQILRETDYQDAIGFAKRRKCEAGSFEDGINLDAMSDSIGVIGKLEKLAGELKSQLDNERHMRMNLEKQVASLRSRLQSEKLKDNEKICQISVQERLSSASTLIKTNSSAPIYLSSHNPKPSDTTLGQKNLGIIVEAILHLENIQGEHMGHILHDRPLENNSLPVVVGGGNMDQKPILSIPTSSCLSINQLSSTPIIVEKSMFQNQRPPSMPKNS